MQDSRFSNDSVIENSKPASDAKFEKGLVGKHKKAVHPQRHFADVRREAWISTRHQARAFRMSPPPVTWEHDDDRSDAARLPSVRKQTKS